MILLDKHINEKHQLVFTIRGFAWDDCEVTLDEFRELLEEQAEIAYTESGANYEYIDKEQWINTWIENRVKELFDEDKE